MPLRVNDVHAMMSRLERTTPGRWARGKVDGSVVALEPAALTTGEAPTYEVLERFGGVPVATDLGEADQEFLLHARGDIKSLVEELDRLIERYNELERSLREAKPKG